MRQWLIGLGGMAVLAAGVMGWNMGSQTTMPVQAVRVVRGEITASISATGTVASVVDVKLAPPAS
ncbi:MAG: hypothetical protein PHE55_12695, partial [Methylococcaceae bacterium]|nr:hypothetical protein [Methylococcaceae bacterium]